MRSLTSLSNRITSEKSVERGHLLLFKCEKCGHIWISQKFDKDNLPISCAKCKNPYWNRPREVKQELEFKEKRKLR